MGERLHMVLGQIGSTLWIPRQQKASFHWGKRCLQASTSTFDPIFVKLAGNEDRHKIPDEFEFQSDWTIYYGVICPWVLKLFPIDLYGENVVSAIMSSFVIRFSSNLQITRKGIKSWTSLNSGHMCPSAPKNSPYTYTFKHKYLRDQLASLGQILCIKSHKF